MTTPNNVLMQRARESLSGKWRVAVPGYAIYMVCIGISGAIHRVGWLITLTIAGPFQLGMAKFSLALSRKQEVKVSMVCDGFRSNYWRTLKAYLLRILFVVLWMLLLIVPGIIASLSYSQTFFIMAEDSNIGASDALKKSKKMMYGYKWKFFCLGFRFFGWALLAILTLGIGFLWLIPYIQVSMAQFYDDVKSQPEFVPQQ